MLRELTEDWRGTAFSVEQYLGQAMATARKAWADDTVTELLDSIDARITSRVLRRALFSAARELVGVDDEVTPEEGTLLSRDRRPLRLIPHLGGIRLWAGIVSEGGTIPPSSGDAADGDAVAAGEVGTDRHVGVAGLAQQPLDGRRPGRRRSPAPASRRGGSAPGRRRRAGGWRRGRRGRRTARRAAPSRRTPASTSGDPSATYGGLATTTSGTTPSGRASNHDPAAMRTLAPLGGRCRRGWPGRRRGRRARRRSATPCTPSTGSSSASASPMAPEPVPRSATVDRARHGPGEVDGDAGDDLGLRPRDQHPAVDEQVEVAEAPPAEHVGERLAGRVAGEHGVEVGDHALRSPARRARRRGGRPRWPPRTATAPPAAHRPGRRLGQQLPPVTASPVTVCRQLTRSRVRRSTGHVASSSASWRARSSAARAATTSSRSPARTSARR